MTTEERRALIREKHAAGASRKELAAEFGISLAAIRVAIQDSYPRRPVPVYEGRKNDRIVELWKQGLSAKHICERLRVNASAVSIALAAAGIDLSGTRRASYESLGGGGTAKQAAQRVARRG